MTTPTLINASRRDFLAGGAGLLLGLYLPDAAAQAGGPARAVAAAPAGVAFEPNAFVRIGSDNTVTVIAKHLEMGRAVYAGLATIVADELDAAWSQVRIEGAPADASRFNNTLWGPMQGTGQQSIANSWDQLRNAGAAARAMLVSAAAKQWSVAPTTIAVRSGVVTAGNRKATFGELAAAAGRSRCPPRSSSRTRRTSCSSASTCRARTRKRATAAPGTPPT